MSPVGHHHPSSNKIFSTTKPAPSYTSSPAMAENIYDEIEIEDMTYDPTLEIYHYPCPCGDRFEIAIADLRDKEDIAVCPSCSLMIRVIFEVDDLPKPPEQEKETASEQVPVAAA